MLVSAIKEENLTLETIDRLLFEGLEDTGENADCIIVLGSLKASQYRVPVAVKAYKEGRADRILLCGGKLRDFPTGKYSEAEHMRQTALRSDVPQDAIIMEDSSQHTVENIQFALSELQRHFQMDALRKVILVTTAYHMRRSLAIARNLFPEHIEVIPCPANDHNTRRENWMNTPIGTQRAKDEAMKIVRYVQAGIIPDFELPQD